MTRDEQHDAYILWTVEDYLRERVRMREGDDKRKRSVWLFDLPPDQRKVVEALEEVLWLIIGSRGGQQHDPS